MKKIMHKLICVLSIVFLCQSIPVQAQPQDNEPIALTRKFSFYRLIQNELLIGEIDPTFKVNMLKKIKADIDFVAKSGAVQKMDKKEFYFLNQLTLRIGELELQQLPECEILNVVQKTVNEHEEYFKGDDWATFWMIEVICIGAGFCAYAWFNHKDKVFMTRQINSLVEAVKDFKAK